MSDKNTYEFLPDAEMLKRFYEGALSEKEMHAFADALANDELLREAFAGINRKEFDTVEAISLSTNEKLKNRFGAPPLSMNWKIWLSVFIGLVTFSIVLMMFNNQSSQENKTVASNERKRRESKNKEQYPYTKPKTVAVHSFYMDESESTSIERETSMNFNSDSKSRNENNTNETVQTDVKENKTENKNTLEGPDGNKTDHKTNDNKNNETTVEPNVKKTYMIRCADAGVLTVQNLAEKEANAGDRDENVDPRDVNIGQPVGDRKQKSYNLEDMPQYKGGNEAMASYVKGRLALKTYKTPQQSFSTVVEFVVTSKGKVEDIKLQNEIDPAMEKDLREILTNLSFTPGKKSGKKGSMHYMMAIMYE